MSKSDDYLEQLLKGMDESENTDIDLDENFFDEDLLDLDLLDKEFTDEDLTDDFLKNFEMDLEEMDEKNESENEFVESEAEETEFVEALFGNLDNIISGIGDVSEASDEDFVVEDFSYDDVGTEVPSMQSVEESSMPKIMKEPQTDDGEADILKILEGLGDLDLELEMDRNDTDERSEESKANDDALLDFLAGGAMTETAELIEEKVVSEEIGETESKDGKKKRKSAKKDEKKGFFSKLGTILFGEDEEEEAKSSEKKIEISEDMLDEVAVVQEFTEDSLDLFKEFITTPKAAAKELKNLRIRKRRKKKKLKKKKLKKKKLKKKRNQSLRKKRNRKNQKNRIIRHHCQRNR